MPYQHSVHAPVLRKALVRLRDENKVSAELLVHLLTKAKRMPTGGQDIKPSTLTAFIRNERESKKVAALAALWDFLHEHPTYRGYFPDESALPEPEYSEQLLGAFSAVCCVRPGEICPPQSNDARFGYAGEFVMFSPPWGGKTDGGSLHVMKCSTQMVTGAFLLDITHAQADGSPPRTFSSGLWQWRGGVCFAGRQCKRDDETSALAYVAIVTETSTASDGDVLLYWFKGVLTATKSVIDFPFMAFTQPIPFFCRRALHYPDEQGGITGDELLLERGELREVHANDPHKEVLKALSSASPAA